jgi:hypothetical protein
MRFLIGRPKLPEKATDRTLTEFCPKFAMDGFCDQTACPQSKVKPELTGITVANQEINPLDLRAVKDYR